jgi:hypothetical protein
MSRPLCLLLFTPLFLISSCVKETSGCLASQACNLNSEATIGSTCEFPSLGYNCEGDIIQYVVGIEVEGGIVFYVDETGEHGLVLVWI